MKINLKQRLRSLPFWTAVASLLGLLLQQASLSSGAGFDSAFYNALTGSVFSILTLLGIIADPTTPGYSDGGPPTAE